METNDNNETIEELRNDCDHAYGKDWYEELAMAVCRDCQTPLDYTLEDYIIEMEDVKLNYDLASLND